MQKFLELHCDTNNLSCPYHRVWPLHKSSTVRCWSWPEMFMVQRPRAMPPGVILPGAIILMDNAHLLHCPERSCSTISPYCVGQVAIQSVWISAIWDPKSRGYAADSAICTLLPLLGCSDHDVLLEYIVESKLFPWGCCCKHFNQLGWVCVFLIMNHDHIQPLISR